MGRENFSNEKALRYFAAPRCGLLEEPSSSIPEHDPSSSVQRKHGIDHEPNSEKARE